MDLKQIFYLRSLDTFLVTGDSCASTLFSPDSFAFNVPLGGLILSVYPVNGTNPIDSEGKSCGTSFVLEKHPLSQVVVLFHHQEKIQLPHHLALT